MERNRQLVSCEVLQQLRFVLETGSDEAVRISLEIACVAAFASWRRASKNAAFIGQDLRIFSPTETAEARLPGFAHKARNILEFVVGLARPDALAPWARTPSPECLHDGGRIRWTGVDGSELIAAM